VVPVEPLTGVVADLAGIPVGRRGLTVEIRTKSAGVKALSDHAGAPHLLWSWTLTPGAWAREFEAGAPAPADRLEALGRALRLSARAAVRLDPFITLPGWEEAYEELFLMLRPLAEGLEDVQIGLFRHPPALRTHLEGTPGGRAFLRGERLLAPDGKVRLLAPQRLRLLRRAVDLARSVLGPRVPLSLCMEPPWMTRRVLGRGTTDS
jgi:hypothetical protein